MNIYPETLKLLRKNKVHMPEIARLTGLNKRWLHRLCAGDYEDPGVNKIEKLNRFLKVYKPESD